MEFKNVLEIATKQITSVGRQDSILKATEVMIQNNLRNVLIVDEGTKEYGIITVNDITDFIVRGVDFSSTIESVGYKIVKQIHKNSNALEASFLIREDITYLCVVDDDKNLLGVVSMSNIISAIDTELVVNDIKLGHIIGKTKAKVAKPTDLLSAVFHKVNATPTEAVVIINDHHLPIGIITKRDIVKLIVKEMDMSLPVKDFMVSPLVTVDENTTVKEALELMSKKKFKRLIVLEKSGELMGVVTREEMMDIVYNKWSQIVREKECELQKLSKTLEARTAESKRSARILEEMMDATDDFIFYKDLDYKYIGCNAAFSEFAGITKQSIAGKTDFDLFDDYYSNLFRDTDRDVIEKGKTIVNSYWTRFKDKKAVYLSVKKSPLKDADGKIIGLIGISRDSTEQKNLEDAIKHQHNYLQTIIDMQDSMLIITSDGNGVIEANKSFLDFYGVNSIEEYHKKYKSIADLFVKKEGYLSNKKHGPWFRLLTSSYDRDFKVLMQRPGDDPDDAKSFLLQVEKFKKDETYLMSFLDITNIEKESKNLEIMATTDQLTKIYNRMKFGNIMEAEIAKARKSKKPLSLVIIDIDHFKKINDTYGHQVGDYVLITAVEIIKTKIRSTDIFARWGGEEFMVLFPGADLEVGVIRSEIFRKTLAEYDFIEPHTVTGSFGVTSFKENDTMDSFIKRADEALYAAKRNGRNRVEALN
ncbi:MAG: diguanylate cyclase [Campylobacterales bacterium]|nr:diguanylate cyclase [Campylobacterales bacterium]